ncbi:nucleoside deaminase [bacterium]|nr:nucleoside deaminase [bacterium]MBU1598620.1 nucleoside deaminase [bacterium]
MSDEYFIREALKEAEKARAKEEVPIGAVAVLNGKIIARRHNEVEERLDPTAHAEILALKDAFGFSKDKWLYGLHLYVTLEPCTMCYGAMFLYRIEKLIFGAYSNTWKKEEDRLLHNLNHKIEIEGGILSNECSEILSEFFKTIR